MTSRKISHLLLPVGMILTAIVIMAGCASKKSIWGDTKKGLILSYRMPEDKTYKYQVTSDVDQAMEINTQKLEVTMKSFQEFSFSNMLPGPDPLSLKVTIDTMYLYIKSPMNEMIPEMKEVIGKRINMYLSSNGHESDLDGAKEIFYVLGPEKRNLGTEFQGFFPNLPDHPVKPGDTWTFNDTIMEESGNNWLGIYSSNNAKLEGYETVGGRECARIVIETTGTISGKGNTQGVDTETVGEFTGTDLVWFDYKEGILIKISSKGTAKSQTKTSGVRQMIIPGTREMTKTIVLTD
ncbi:MAG: hypothetical protein IH596_10970 [Bacteroidales bacterium]|nr:hypothetical protein [Bacteroidales bacterium]